MSVTAAKPTRTRIAVFGSIAAERPVPLDDPAPADQGLSPAARAVLEGVLATIAARAPSIARPILDRAVADGSITRAERHELLRELSGPRAGGDDEEPGTTPASFGARVVMREAFAAIRRAAPGIARPILDEAVGAERLTAAQEQRILERLRIGPSRLRTAGDRPFALSA